MKNENNVLEIKDMFDSCFLKLFYIIKNKNDKKNTENIFSY